MTTISLARPTLGQVGRSVEIHPLELIRVLVAENLLSSDLRFSAPDVARIEKVAGLETWWEDLPTTAGDESHGQILMRGVLRQMVHRNVLEPYATRADNLFRGLDPASRTVMRRVVNALIRESSLVTRMTGHGLVVTIPATSSESVRMFLERRSGALIDLWRTM